MMGQLAPVGTGSFDLVLDEEKLERAMDMDGGAGGGGGGLLMKEQHPMTPSMMTPMHSSPFAVMSPGQQGGLFSPFAGGGGMSPSSQAMFSPFGGHQADGNAAIFSPSHSMMSPASFSPGGGGVSPGYSPTSPAYSPTQDSCFATLCLFAMPESTRLTKEKTQPQTPNPKPQTISQESRIVRILRSLPLSVLCLSARIKELTRANQNHYSSPTSPAQVHCLASCFSCLGRTTRN